MKISRALKVHNCFNCEADLKDRNFVAFGVAVNPQRLFFDYRCPKCRHHGRYTVEPEHCKTVPEMFDCLSKLLVEDSTERPRNIIQLRPR